MSERIIKTWTGHPKPIEISTNWIEPFPHDSLCFWWWGSRKACEKICQWADETAVPLQGYCGSLSNLTSEKGYFRTLHAFCEIALTNGLGDPPLVVTRCLSDASRVQSHQRTELPLSLKSVQLSHTFHVVDVFDDVVTFALEVLDFLIGDVPQLVVDVSTQGITYKGIRYPVFEEAVLLFDLLYKNLGKPPLTEAACIAACPKLADGRFGRRIKEKLPKILREILKSKPGYGWWLNLDCFASVGIGAFLEL